MNKENIVSPSILSANFINLEKDINKVKEFGAQWLHIDVMDGHFVPNLTIGLPVIKSISQNTDMFLDVHLMISNPEKYINEYAACGSDLITFHYEATLDKTNEVINKIKSNNKKVGLSIKPHTDIHSVLPYINDIDLLLLMTVEPGFSGQKFMKEGIEKIIQIKDKIPNNLLIQVDGGINQDTAKICRGYGANVFVAGNYVFHNENMKNAINLLKNM